MISFPVPTRDWLLGLWYSDPTRTREHALLGLFVETVGAGGPLLLDHLPFRSSSFT